MAEEVCVGGLGGSRAGWGSEASEEFVRCVCGCVGVGERD